MIFLRTIPIEITKIVIRKIICLNGNQFKLIRNIIDTFPQAMFHYGKDIIVIMPRCMLIEDSFLNFLSKHNMQLELMTLLDIQEWIGKVMRDTIYLKFLSYKWTQMEYYIVKGHKLSNGHLYGLIVNAYFMHYRFFVDISLCRVDQYFFKLKQVLKEGIFEMFNNNQDYVIEKKDLKQSLCYCLPYMHDGNIVAIYHGIPSHHSKRYFTMGSEKRYLTCYEDYRLCWLTLYDIHLPKIQHENHVFVEVNSMDETNLLPSCCIRTKPNCVKRIDYSDINDYTMSKAYIKYVVQNHGYRINHIYQMIAYFLEPLMKEIECDANLGISMCKESNHLEEMFNLVYRQSCEPLKDGSYGSRATPLSEFIEFSRDWIDSFGKFNKLKRLSTKCIERRQIKNAACPKPNTDDQENEDYKEIVPFNERGSVINKVNTTEYISRYKVTEPKVFTMPTQLKQFESIVKINNLVEQLKTKLAKNNSTNSDNILPASTVNNLSKKTLDKKCGACKNVKPDGPEIDNLNKIALLTISCNKNYGPSQSRGLAMKESPPKKKQKTNLENRITLKDITNVPMTPKSNLPKPCKPLELSKIEESDKLNDCKIGEVFCDNEIILNIQRILQENPLSLQEVTKGDLKTWLRANAVKGYSKLKKNDLIELVKKEYQSV